MSTSFLGPLLFVRARVIHAKNTPFGYRIMLQLTVRCVRYCIQLLITRLASIASTLRFTRRPRACTQSSPRCSSPRA